MAQYFVPGLGMVTTIDPKVEKALPKEAPIDPGKEFGMEFAGDPFFGRLERTDKTQPGAKVSKPVEEEDGVANKVGGGPLKQTMKDASSKEKVKEEGDPVDVSDYAAGGPTKPAEKIVAPKVSNAMPDVFKPKSKSLTSQVYVPSSKEVGEVVKSFTREDVEIVIVKSNGLYKEYRCEDLMPIEDKHFAPSHVHPEDMEGTLVEEEMEHEGDPDEEVPTEETTEMNEGAEEGIPEKMKHDKRVMGKARSNRLGDSEDMDIAKAVEEVIKHLPTRHDQKTHGRFSQNSNRFPDQASAGKAAKELTRNTGKQYDVYDIGSGTGAEHKEKYVVRQTVIGTQKPSVPFESPDLGKPPKITGTLTGSKLDKMGSYIHDWVSTQAERPTGSSIRAFAKRSFGDIVDTIPAAEFKRAWFQYESQ